MSYKDKRVFLKVKIKSLSDESRIIRAEERKTSGQIRDLLALHRKGGLRDEARLAHLAYAFIRGKSYRQAEVSGKRTFDMKRFREMVKRFGPIWSKDESYKDYCNRLADFLTRIDSWLEEAYSVE